MTYVHYFGPQKAASFTQQYNLKQLLRKSTESMQILKK